MGLFQTQFFTERVQHACKDGSTCTAVDIVPLKLKSGMALVLYEPPFNRKDAQRLLSIIWAGLMSPEYDLSGIFTTAAVHNLMQAMERKYSVPFFVVKGNRIPVADTIRFIVGQLRRIRFRERTLLTEGYTPSDVDEHERKLKNLKLLLQAVSNYFQHEYEIEDEARVRRRYVESGAVQSERQGMDSPGRGYARFHRG